MRIAILTYQTLHRKTIDTLCGLKVRGYKDVCVYAMPLTYKKKFKPYFEHRPNVNNLFYNENITYKQIIVNLGYKLTQISDYIEINEPSETVFLVCGAGIIPRSFVKKYRIINAHPGYIPFVRGLDALKWAIVENNPIGVSAHLIGDYIDAGEIIDRKMIPIYQSDTFHAIAQRQYEMEIAILISSISKINENHQFTDGEGYIVHKRMPKEVEKNFIDLVQKYIETNGMEERD